MRRPFRLPPALSPPSMRLDPALALLFALTLGAVPVVARAQAEPPQAKPDSAVSGAVESGNHWRLMGSPYTVHYHKDNEGEHEPIYMIGLERQRNDGWLWGGVYFSNSFGQPSAYVYVGEKVINFSRWDKLFFQWTAGVLYGYKEPYEDKVPFNYKGFSPGVTVGLGWQFTRDFSVQAVALGAAGLMFQLAIDLR
jgi:hypothetical protein